MVIAADQYFHGAWLAQHAICDAAEWLVGLGCNGSLDMFVLSFWQAHCAWICQDASAMCSDIPRSRSVPGIFSFSEAENADTAAAKCVLWVSPQCKDCVGTGQLALGKLGRYLVAGFALSEFFGGGCMMLIVMWRIVSDTLPDQGVVSTLTWQGQLHIVLLLMPCTLCSLHTRGPALCPAVFGSILWLTNNLA